MKSSSAIFACMCIVAASSRAISGNTGDLADARPIGTSQLPAAVAAADHRIAPGTRIQSRSSAPESDTASAIRRTDLATAYGRLPIRFEPNRGQAPTGVKYIAHDAGYSIALTDEGAVLGLAATTRPGNPMQAPNDHRAERSGPACLRVGLVGANPRPRMSAEQRQGSVSNYFIGGDASLWQRDIPNYAAVRYQQVYPGIDWIVYGNPQRLEYDLDVAPHADVGSIKLDFANADTLAVDPNGDLLVAIGDRTIRQLKPVVYQKTSGGQKQPIEGRYVVEHRHAAFAIGNYDHARELIIDPTIINPTIVYSTYLGGSGRVGSGNDGDAATAIAVDDAGNAYIAGGTHSRDFPLSTPLQSKNKAATLGENVFITKLNATGTAIVYSTYLGGIGLNGTLAGDDAAAIAVDRKGNVYVAGRATSRDFPLMRPIQKKNRSSFSNAFVTKLNAAGNALVYSTFLGGTGIDAARAIAIDAAGNAYVAGDTTSADFPIVHAFEKSPGGSSYANIMGPQSTSSAFVAKINAKGDALVYSTYLGGKGYRYAYGSKLSPVEFGEGDEAHAIAVDKLGNAYIAGITRSTDFPTLKPFQSKNKSGQTGFVTKLNPAGTALVYSTYLGGSTPGDKVDAIAVDAAGDAYVGGVAYSKDFPTAHPFQSSNRAPSGSNVCGVGYQSELQPVLNCGTGFVAKLSLDGSKLVFSTYLGGTGQLFVGVRHPRGGFAPSGDFPYRNGFGDAVNAIALDKSNHVYVTGTTASKDFPIAMPVQALAKLSETDSSDDHDSAYYSGFITELSADGATVPFSTWLGGSHGNQPNALAVDASGNIYVAGTTNSDDFPLVHALQKVNLGYLDEYRRYAQAHGLPQPKTGFYTDGGRPSWDGDNAFVAKISAPAAPDLQNSPAPGKN